MNGNFIKEFINSAIKKFEVFETFYNNKQGNIDFKTRLDAIEIEDMAILHTVHDYMVANWKYNSPINGLLERKKMLKVSENGESLKTMENVLKSDDNSEETNKKNNWDKLMGVAG